MKTLRSKGLTRRCLVLALATFAAACASEPVVPPAACVALESQACDCPNGTVGEQSCASDGSGFGSCERCVDSEDDGGEPDGGEPDGGEPDGGEPDGGEPDGGEPDGGEPDGGEPDGGEPDGGEPDGGEPDGGEEEPPCTSPFVYLKDRQFRLGDEPYVPMSVNYIFDVRYETDPDGGRGTYYIGPHGSFCRGSCCNDEASCRETIREQLAQIKSLGFNSLRVAGLSVKPKDRDLRLNCAWQHLPEWLDYCPEEGMLDVRKPDDRAIAFRVIEDALALAAEAGLKVILLAGHGAVDSADSGGSMPQEGPMRDQYARYLHALSSHFADNPTVFAYDLTNEPVYEFANKAIDKVAGNAIGRLWYDAVRAGSTRHMVTMGLAEVGTVEHWDPGSLPLDFLSWHLYGSSAFDQKDRNHLASQYTWLDRQATPYIVGETGLQLGVDGVAGATEAAQKDFARFSLDTSFACGAMGFQWWLYRDTLWAPDDAFGLVRQDGTARTATEVFSAFTPPLPRPACPSFAYVGSNASGTSHTKGRLLHEDGTPVANGYVAGDTCYVGGWEWTLSDADGYFDLRSKYAVKKLKAMAPGLSVVTINSPLCLSPNPGDITLSKLAVDVRVSTPSSCH